MSRRITLAILGSVFAALVLAGAGTLLVNRAVNRQQTESDLRQLSAGVMAIIPNSDAIPVGYRRRELKRIADGLNLEGISVIAIGPQGRVLGELPDGVTTDQLDIAALQAGDTVSGRTGKLAYAATGRSYGATSIAVIVTRPLDKDTGGWRWFLLSAGITLVIAVLIAWWLGRALTGPLRRADLATRRIAGGDLTTRLPTPPVGADDELADLTRSINVMAEELERSQGLERQFLLSVSHDLRTPLTSIRGYAEAIADGTAPDHAQAAGVIQSESRRLERLVRDLLDLAKLDARTFTFHPQPVVVDEVVGDVADGFRREVQQAGLQLAVDRDPSLSKVVADPDRLAQAIANLVENALKYATGGLRVSTTVEPPAPWAPDGVVLVAVTDDGPGIPPPDLPHVFERLYVTAHRPARKESGSGLGLAIVRELLAAMGGSVAAESPVLPTGGGTRMLVRLPRVP